jgi:dCTP deaminase
VRSIHAAEGRVLTDAAYSAAVAVLSDADLRKLLAKGEVRIDPFSETNLTPNGYDVTIAEVAVPSRDLHVTDGDARVPPAARFAVSTREVVELGPGVAAQLWLRTTWIRRGVLASFGLIDSGFRGTLTLGAYNASDGELVLPIGERFAQIVFVALTSASEKGYGERSGTYQDQRGVRLK